MSDVRPFQALRYDTSRVNLGKVLVPPYDVIAAADRVRLYEGEPHSAIRLELTKKVEEEASTDYSEIRDTLAGWRKSKLLVRDERPAFYALRQRFKAPDGQVAEREGFFGLLRIEDYETRIVRPHERTLAGPKADRLKILRATRANLSSVFLLYEDREDGLHPLLAPAFGEDLLAEATDEAGLTHVLARIEDPERIEAITRYMADRPLVIADGHHRYETAKNYRDEQRAAQPDSGPEAPHEFLLVNCANAFAPGTLLLPIHRLIRKGSVPSDAAWSERLPGWTQKKVALPSAEAIPELLAEHLAPLRDDHYAFVADDTSGQLRVFSRPRPADGELSVRIIHREVIEGVFGLDEDTVRGGAISYPKSTPQTAKDVRAGEGCVALYLNPLAPDDVFRVTAAGEVMPQKSTFFFPKLPTGLVFRLLDEAAS
jgi:uncharacterized protein (DUF1015 family)